MQSVISVIRDISALKRLQHQFEVLARTDPLTLMNRRSFSSSRSTPSYAGRRPLSLLLLDADDQVHQRRVRHVVGDEI